VGVSGRGWSHRGRWVSSTGLLVVVVTLVGGSWSGTGGGESCGIGWSLTGWWWLGCWASLTSLRGGGGWGGWASLTSLTGWWWSGGWASLTSLTGWWWSGGWASSMSVTGQRYPIHMVSEGNRRELGGGSPGLCAMGA
jgi:hypothetical protein